MPVFCCGVCEHWLPPPEAKILWGWCEVAYPVSREFVDVDAAGGLPACNEDEGCGQLRTTESMVCEKFVLINIRKKQEHRESD